MSGGGGRCGCGGAWVVGGGRDTGDGGGWKAGRYLGMALATEGEDPAADTGGDRAAAEVVGPAADCLEEGGDGRAVGDEAERVVAVFRGVDYDPEPGIVNLEGRLSG